MDDGTFSFGNGKLKYENDTLKVKNAEIVGGSFKVQTSDSSEALIEFNSGLFKVSISSSGIALTSTLSTQKVTVQHDGIYLWNGDIDPILESEIPTIFINSAGTIDIIKGDIMLGDVSLKNYIQTHP